MNEWQDVAEDVKGRAGPGMVHTYSIVALDEETRQMGVAVQSRAFCVGSLVPWGEPGVGVVATQASVDVSYGPLGLALMRAGKSATESLTGLVAADSRANVRQVAMLDAQGDVAVHTGKDCMDAAGHRAGNCFSAQANLMLKSTVWGAMGEAFEAAEGDLAERLLVALEAAEGEGGDIRGKQSAALLVVSGDGSAKPGYGREVDLRVDDHPKPLVELRRLLRLSRAARRWHAATEVLREDPVAEGSLHWALGEYDRALSLLDRDADIAEVSFWKAVTLLHLDEREEALALFRFVFGVEPAWRHVIPRLVPVGILQDDPTLVERIMGLDSTHRS